jgi:hypothetical protein
MVVLWAMQWCSNPPYQLSQAQSADKHHTKHISKICPTEEKYEIYQSTGAAEDVEAPKNSTGEDKTVVE